MGLFDGSRVKITRHPYLTDAERKLFIKSRESGHYSFFRTGSCKVCGAEVPKSKNFCSKACYENQKK